MSQFESTFGEPDSSEQKTSGLAIASLVSSLICCLPITTILGILLGVGAMVSIGNDPAKKGKGLAIAGIVLGAVFTAGQAICYPPGYRFFKAFYELVEKGPRDVLTAGFAGDPIAFRAEFYGAGAAASDAEVLAFVGELRGRYGEFVGSRIDQTVQPTYGQPAVPFPYLLEFENATVNAEVEIVFADPNVSGDFINKLGYITVFDEELGDLTFPAEADEAEEVHEHDDEGREHDDDEGHEEGEHEEGADEPAGEDAG